MVTPGSLEPGRCMFFSVRSFVMSIFVLALVLDGAAHADKVDRLITQLTTSKDYKIRLSAAINLAKLGDQRAVPAFVSALEDSDKNVRGVAATSLGKLVNGSTAAKTRDRVVSALESAAAKDPEEFVREQASKAVEAISQVGSGGGSIYVDIGAMTAKTGESEAMRDLMRTAVEKAFAKKAAHMMTAWPGGKSPSANQLRDSKMKAFHVDGTLVSLDAQSKGSTTLVSCKISMLIATYPKKSMFGFLDGGAKVQASSSPTDIKYAKEDCVMAVVEDLIAKKIVPAIETRSN